MQAGRPQPRPLLGDAEDLPLHRTQRRRGQDQVLRAHLRAGQEADRTGAVAELVALEGQHLPAKDVVFDHQLLEPGEEGLGRFLVGGQRFQGHPLLAVLPVGAALQDRHPGRAGLDQPDPELHAGPGLGRRDLDPLVVHRAGFDRHPVPGHVDELGQAVVAAELTRETHQLPDRVGSTEQGLQGDLDVRVVVARIAAADHGQPGRSGAEVCGQLADEPGLRPVHLMRHPLQECPEQRREAVDVGVRGMWFAGARRRHHPALLAHESGPRGEEANSGLEQVAPGSGVMSGFIR